MADSKYTEAEMEQITLGSVDKDIQAAVDQVLPGWKISKCGSDMDPGKRGEYRGRKDVMMTHPLNRQVACVLTRNVKVPADKSTMRLVVTHDTRGDWTLIAKADGKQLVKKAIDPQSVSDDWVTVDLDLSAWAGKTVKVELLNQANGWAYEAAYWGEIGWK